jgi:hypothetical protein
LPSLEFTLCRFLRLRLGSISTKEQEESTNYGGDCDIPPPQRNSLHLQISQVKTDVMKKRNLKQKSFFQIPFDYPADVSLYKLSTFLFSSYRKIERRIQQQGFSQYINPYMGGIANTTDAAVS